MPSSRHLSSEQNTALITLVRAAKLLRRTRLALTEDQQTQEAFDDANVAYRQAEVACIELFPHEEGECACVMSDTGFVVVPNLDGDRCLVLPIRQ